MGKNITITLANDSSTYDLKFELFNTNIANKWYTELEEFIQSGQSLDDCERFYNFPHSKYTEEYVVNYLNYLIDTINSHKHIIETRAQIGMTQDTLNYLHHIFEVYHGLYDSQLTNKFFMEAPKSVQLALGDLNIWVHRYETLGGIPRFVGTWYNKPCRKLLDTDDFNEFTLVEHWGDLKINYCEVGKTLFDLYHDNDRYIDPAAFKPLHYYSVDFTVRFTNNPEEYYLVETDKVWEYYDQHSDFFLSQGYVKYDAKLSLGSITVGKIITTEPKEVVIEQIGLHQKIQKIII